LVDQSGKPGGAAYVYMGGKLGQNPPPSTYYYQAGGRDALMAPPSPEDSSMMTKLTTLSTVAYFGAGAATAISLWYLCSLMARPHSKKSTEDFQDNKSEDYEAESSETEEKKVRRRRDVRKSDEDMTKLASIVLSAVQSGECLQKSICLLGTQMSGRKGKMADGLMSTLLPAQIQQSDYYIILRRSLRGEMSCEKFGCNH
jgi:hypothetical protein